MCLVASVRPFVCRSELPCLIITYFTVFVCVSVIRGAHANNLADAVDGILMLA